MDDETDVFGQRKETFGESVEERYDVVDFDAHLAAEGLELPVGARDAALDELTQTGRMAEIEDANTAPRDLVLVRGADTAPGRSDCLVRRILAVEQLVIW
jgi:hypothetical protein